MAPPPDYISAVIARSSGEIAYNTTNHSDTRTCVPATVMATDAAFTRGQLCFISARIGMPLRVLKIVDGDEYSFCQAVSGEDYGCQGKNENAVAGALMSTPGLEEPGVHYSYEPLQEQLTWSRNGGNVLIVREDKGPLLVHHIEMVLEFIHHVNSEMYTWRSRLAEWDEEFELAGLLTKGMFKEWFIEKEDWWRMERMESQHLLALPKLWRKPAGIPCAKAKVARARQLMASTSAPSALEGMTAEESEE